MILMPSSTRAGVVGVAVDLREVAPRAALRAPDHEVVRVDVTVAAASARGAFA